MTYLHAPVERWWSNDHRQAHSRWSDHELPINEAEESSSVVAPGSNIVEQEEATLSVVHLRGLPYRATVQDIIGFLGSHASNLRDGSDSVQLVMNHKGRPSGFAKLWFDTPKAAAACCSELHLRNLEDRYIEVFLLIDSLDSRKQGMRRQGVRQQNFTHRMSQQVSDVAPEMQEVQEGPAQASEKFWNPMPTPRHSKDKVQESQDTASDGQPLMSSKNDILKSIATPDRSGNAELCHRTPTMTSVLPNPCMLTSDMIAPPYGYCGDGFIMDDGALQSSYMENPYPGYVAQVQFVPYIVYCPVVADPSMQNGDAEAMGETFPDATQSDPAGEATPLQQDVDMSNNWENVKVDQEGASCSRSRNNRRNKWVDLLKLVPKQSNDSRAHSELS